MYMSMYMGMGMGMSMSMSMSMYNNMYNMDMDMDRRAVVRGRCTASRLHTNTREIPRSRGMQHTTLT